MAIINFTSPARLQVPPVLGPCPSLSETPAVLCTKSSPESVSKYFYIKMNALYRAATKLQLYFMMMPMQLLGLSYFEIGQQPHGGQKF